MMYYSNTKFYCHSQLDLEGTGNNSNFFSIWKYAKGRAFFAETFRNELQNLILNIDELLALDSVRSVLWRPWSSCQTTRLTRPIPNPVTVITGPAIKLFVLTTVVQLSVAIKRNVQHWLFIPSWITLLNTNASTVHTCAHALHTLLRYRCRHAHRRAKVCIQSSVTRI